jgi:rfaE bifunctional protein nucleotidyltransferase chain/domain
LFPKAAVLQFEITAGDADVNLQCVEKLFNKLAPEKNTIIVLPELWGYGFDYLRITTLIEQTPHLLKGLQKLAAQRQVFFAGSLLEKSPGTNKPYNTLFVIGPEGVIGTYRKQNLFGLWKEDVYFSQGYGFKPIDTDFGPLGALICYDLRFPLLTTSQAFHGARLIVVSAQWPTVRVDHWKTLLCARAIENQVFIAAANSCGQTGNNKLAGHSMIIGPDGMILSELGLEEGAVDSLLKKDDLETLRFRFCSVGQRSYPFRLQDKIVNMSELHEALGKIRRQGSKVAFTNGCFDILHSGHVDYLEHARITADCLVVGLNSDSSVKGLKGANRPVNSEKDRARVLAALACVDYVILFDEDTPYSLITSLMPNVLVKGADWPEDRIVGAEDVKIGGGTVVRIPFKHNVSTTQIISKIQKNEANREES